MSVWFKIALLLLGIGTTIFLVLLTWPVSLLLLLSLAIWCVTWQSKSGIRKALHSAASSWILGFGLLAVLLLIFNCIPSAHDINVVGPIETHLIEFNSWIEKHTDFHWQTWLLVFAGIIVLGRLLPEWKLISRSLRIKALVEKTASVMAIVASFTFTTSLAADHEQQRVHSIIVARYENAHEQRREAWRKYLAAESIRRLVPQLDRATLSDYSGLFRGLNNVARSFWNSRFSDNDVLYLEFGGTRYTDTIVDGYARQDIADLGSRIIIPPRQNSRATPARSLPAVTDPLDKQFAELRSEEAGAAYVGKEADDAADATKEAFSSALDAADSGVKDWADEYVEEAVRSYAKALSPFVPQFVDELFSEYTDHFVDANAELLKRVFKSKVWQRVGRNPNQLIVDLRQRFTNFVSERTDELSDAAATLAAQAKKAHNGKDLATAKQDIKQSQDLVSEARKTLQWLGDGTAMDSGDNVLITAAKEHASQVAGLVKDVEEHAGDSDGAWKVALEKAISIGAKAAKEMPK